MKTIYSFVLVAVLCALFTCCKNEKPKTRLDMVEEFRSGLTNDDSLTVVRMCDNAMEMLMNKQYDEVLAMLNEYTDSTKEVKPLSPQTAAKYLRKFKMFPVMRYERKYFSFQLEGCNDVKYDVIFASAKDAGIDKPAVIGYMFNPVKVDGEWRLCVKTENDFYDVTKQ